MQVENITNFKMPDLLPVGTVCNLIDLIDPTDGVLCTIKLVEQDDEDQTLFYYYLRANDETKNIQYDSRIGMYFDIIVYSSDRLIVLAPPTTF